MLSIFDVILAILLSGFLFYGLFFGLVKVLGNLFGTIFGVILASRYYLLVYEALEKTFFGFENAGKVISFIIAFSLIRKVISVAVAALNTAFNLISIIPFLTTINRVGGAILGTLEGGMIIGTVLFLSSRYAIVESFFGQWIIESRIAPLLIKIASILTPLMPDVLKSLNSLI